MTVAKDKVHRITLGDRVTYLVESHGRLLSSMNTLERRVTSAELDVQNFRDLACGTFLTRLRWLLTGRIL